MRIREIFIHLGCLFLFSGPTSDCFAGGEWIFQSSGISTSLRGVFLAGRSRIYAIGDSGGVLRTTDGGDTWTSLNAPTTADLYGIAFFDSLSGFVVGDSGVVLQTVDGGTTWLKRNSGTGVLLRAITVVDRLNAVAVGDGGAILRTTNAGVTWRKSVSGTSGILRGVTFPTQMSGTIVGDNAIILHTTDGGTTWQQQSSGVTGTLAGVDFPDSLRGFAADSKGSVLHTTNGGAAWFVGMDPPCCGSLNAIRFTTADTGTVVGNSGRIFRTTDGGLSWTQQAVNMVSDWLAAGFADGSNGTVVGSLGKVIHTTSGGGDSVLFPVFLASPLNGFTGQLIEHPLCWHPFEQAYSYIVQVTTDSTFSSNLLLNDSTVVDTFKYVGNLLFGSRHFWRVRARTLGGTNVWSSVWHFTAAEYPPLTAKQIQEQPSDSLLLADALQNTSPSRWKLQASPFQGVPVRLTVVCVVPPNIIKGDAQTVIAYDTGAVQTGWHGISVQADSEFLPVGFTKIRRGDVLQMRGVATETPEGSMNSMTVFKCRFLKVVDSLHSIPAPQPVFISDFHSGAYPNGRMVYSRGEQYEGMIVEMNSVTVSAIFDSAGETVELVDGNSNTVMALDLSRWCTLRSHRDSMSTFSIPPIGAHIDTLRGIILAGTKGNQTGSDYGYCITPVYPGDIVYGSPNRGVIKGSVFSDINVDSTRNPGEPGMPLAQVNVSGKMHTETLANAIGDYAVNGLGPGTYTVAEDIPAGSRFTVPSAGYYVANIGENDTVGALNFGVHFPLNTITGFVYDDVNENGIFDSTDNVLSAWVVRSNGYINDSASTDSSGNYTLWRVYYGTSVVTLGMQPGWEQILPPVQQGYVFMIRNIDQHITGATFSVHRIPRRVKPALTIHDNTFSNQRDVWWGVRPGATYGIWGVDPNCASADFSEGELELPPVLPLIFDARFVDPHATEAQFGNGSWTDMRAYVSSTQVDTYYVQFSPGRVDGGDYPMTLRWSRKQIANLYGGPVVLEDRFGMSVDMKSFDSLLVTDPNTSGLLLVAQEPILHEEAVGSGLASLPREFALNQNYPNPFNPTTVVSYKLPVMSYVKLSVYNILGQVVKAIVNSSQGAGYKSVEWNASTNASGVYFYRLEATSMSVPVKLFVQVRKMLIIK